MEAQPERGKSNDNATPQFGNKTRNDRSGDRIGEWRRRFSMDNLYCQSSRVLKKIRRFSFRNVESISQNNLQMKGQNINITKEEKKFKISCDKINKGYESKNYNYRNDSQSQKRFRGFDSLPDEIILCIFSYLLDLHINSPLWDYSNSVREFRTSFYSSRGLKQRYIQANNLLSIRAVSKAWRIWTNQSIASLRTCRISSNLSREMIEIHLIKARKISVDKLNLNPVKDLDPVKEVHIGKDNQKINFDPDNTQDLYYHCQQYPVREEDNLCLNNCKKTSTMKSIFQEKLNFLAMLTQCRNLTNISFRNLELLVDDDLKLISKLHFLQSLNIGGCVHVTDEGIYNLCFSKRRDINRKLQNSKYIEKIKYTSSTSTESQGLHREFHQINHELCLPYLKYLNVSMTQVSDDSLDTFMESKIGKNLSSLTLYGLRSISEGKVFTFLKEAKTLSSLNIRGVTSLSPQESLRIKLFGKTKKVPVSCTVLIGPPIENSVYSRY